MEVLNIETLWVEIILANARYQNFLSRTIEDGLGMIFLHNLEASRPGFIVSSICGQDM